MNIEKHQQLVKTIEELADLAEQNDVIKVDDYATKMLFVTALGFLVELQSHSSRNLR